MNIINTFKKILSVLFGTPLILILKFSDLDLNGINNIERMSSKISSIYASVKSYLKYTSWFSNQP